MAVMHDNGGEACRMSSISICECAKYMNAVHIVQSDCQSGLSHSIVFAMGASRTSIVAQHHLATPVQ